MPVTKRKDRNGYLVTIVFPPGVHVPGEGGDFTTSGAWRLRKTFRGSLKEAKRYEVERRGQLMRKWAELENGKRDDVPTLGEFVEEFRAHLVAMRLRASTLRQYDKWLRKHVVPFFGSMRLDEIKRSELDAFKRQLGLGAATINGCLVMVSSILKLAREDGYEFPLPRFRMAPRPSRRESIKYWDAEQTARVVAALESEARLRNWVLLGISTGLRVGELCGLRWSDVDLVSGYIDVRQQYSGGEFKGPKKDSYRRVPLNETSRAALLAQRAATYMAGGLVFRTRRGKPYDHNTYGDAFKRLQRKAGVVVLSPKCMRHTFATRYMTEGGRIEVLSDLMGHKSIKTTQIYAQITDTARARDAVAFPDLLARG